MTDERFKNRKEALEWLQGRGQISQGKFYKDCESGLVTVHADKTVSKWQVMEYAEREFGQVRQTATSADYAAKKERLELEKLELDIERKKRENRKDDRDWIHRDKVFEREGALVGSIMGEVRYYLDKAAPAIVTLCRGDASRISEVKKEQEEAVFAAFRAIYESNEVDITFEDEVE